VAFNFIAESLTNKNKIMKKIIFVCIIATMSTTTIFASQRPLVAGQSLKVLHDAFPQDQETSFYISTMCVRKPLTDHDKISFNLYNSANGVTSRRAGYYVRQNPKVIAMVKPYSREETFNAPELFNIGIESISKKVLKHFNREFNNPPGVKWEQVGDKFLATFLSGETTTKILFDEKGRLIYTINYSSGKLLPFGIKKLVNRKYKTYQITSVAKINEDNRQIWVVKLTGENDCVTATIEDGEIEETENFQKAN